MLNKTKLDNLDAFDQSINASKQKEENYQESTLDKIQRMVDEMQVTLPKGSITRNKSGIKNEIEENKNKISGSYMDLEEDLLEAEDGKTIYIPEYVSLDKKDIAIEDADSKQMKAIKTAVIDYQKAKDEKNLKSAMVIPELQKVIAMCNNYTFWKFRGLKFGKAAKRLREVRALRTAAEAELNRITANVDKLSEDKKLLARRVQYTEMMKNKDYYAPQILSLKSETMKEIKKDKEKKVEFKEKVSTLKKLIKQVRSYYPKMKYDEAVEIASHYLGRGRETLEGILLEDMDRKVSLGVYVDKKTKEMKEYFPKMSQKDAEAFATRAREEGLDYTDYDDLVKVLGSIKATKLMDSHDKKVQKDKENETIRNKYGKVGGALLKVFFPIAIKNCLLEEKLEGLRLVVDKTDVIDSDKKNYVPNAFNDDDYENTFI